MANVRRTARHWLAPAPTEGGQGVVGMPQCNVCMTEIDESEDTHIEVVKPMEWKGDTQEVRHYYCSVGCLLEQVQD